MELKVKDLIPGEFYFIEFGNDSSIEVEKELVFQHKDGLGTEQYPNDKDRPNAFCYVSRDKSAISGGSFVKPKPKCTPWITERKCREATPLEKAWLKSCVAADRFVEKPVNDVFFRTDWVVDKHGKNMDWYINIVGLEDVADERIMGNFSDDFKFIGFSKMTNGPVFKLKENGQSAEYWENVIGEINRTGGLVMMISNLPDHIEEEQMTQ